MKLIIANWKMSLDKQATNELLHNIKTIQSTNEVVVCPSPAYLSLGHELLQSTAIKLGAQNCAYLPQGAMTGETSVLSLKDFSCTYCIIGHSERRTLFGETNAIVAKKAELCMAQNIMPVICIGETAQENENGLTETVLAKQIAESIPTGEAVIAYEPIWAIGTGKSATTAELSKIYAFLMQKLPGHKLLYGGSVTPDNAQDIVDIPGVDGLLIGGASLDAAKFATICEIK